MFTQSDIMSLGSVSGDKYHILTSNCHDITICSLLTGHEWIIVSDYGARGCYLFHRHSRGQPFHRQRGQYSSLEKAIDYIEGHDMYYAKKRRDISSRR